MAGKPKKKQVLVENKNQRSTKRTGSKSTKTVDVRRNDVDGPGAKWSKTKTKTNNKTGETKTKTKTLSNVGGKIKRTSSKTKK